MNNYKTHLKYNKNDDQILILKGFWGFGVLGFCVVERMIRMNYICLSFEEF